MPTHDTLAVELRQKAKEKKILLMTHIVLGYPSFAVNRQVIRQMVAKGVDIIEMQIPFSEPMADGPVILKANQDALAAGTTVAACLDFAAEMATAAPIPFLFMTYYNIIFRFGEEAFCRKSAALGIRGAIVPDLPPEEGGTFFGHAAAQGLATVPIFAPTSTEERLRELATHGRGFAYCVARRGVTGADTHFDAGFSDYMARCRRATTLPLAVGFGIKSAADVESLRGLADIAVIGSETIRLVDREGPEAVGAFIHGLRRP